MRAVAVLFALASQLALASCGSSGPDNAPQIPLTSFSTPINLTNQEYAELRRDNGSAYVKGGVRGLIVVRQNSSTYHAFERNCPYRANDTCARVKIDPSLLFLKDACCGSQFDLQGRVQGGPTVLPLRQYSTSLSGSILTITN
ncbi:hypothetical protein GCM10022406_02820 [Hymenobacter algoricola]|uniref:Rieske domain-containing protein n=1 Tax=Hymenobacter algoricola TaxID=486267 RepID=A0ABP7MFN0_9BACT